MTSISFIKEKNISFSMWKVGIILFLLLLCVTSAHAANETNINFQDLNLGAHSDLEIYGQNLTTGEFEFIGIYNTTSQLSFEPGNYNVIVRGSAIARLFNPVTLLTDAFAWMETYWLQIILAFGLVVLILRKW